MTEFDKPVQRRTRGAYSVLYIKPEKIVVRLSPGDLIEFRQVRGKTRWVLPADTAFKYAVRLKTFAAMTEKRRKKKAGET